MNFLCRGIFLPKRWPMTDTKLAAYLLYIDAASGKDICDPMGGVGEAKPKDGTATSGDMRRSMRTMQQQATSKMRVYLVEDQALLRETLSAMLKEEPRIEVVGEAEDAMQALQELETLDADAVLMDILLPGIDGIEATRLLKEKRPDLAVVLASHDGEYFEAAIEAGATGYIMSSCTPEQLVRVALLACQGQMLINNSLISSLVLELNQLRKTQRTSLLTPRQVEILKIVASGCHHK